MALEDKFEGSQFQYLFSVEFNLSCSAEPELAVKFMLTCVLLKQLCLEPLFFAPCFFFTSTSCPRFKGSILPSGLNTFFFSFYLSLLIYLFLFRLFLQFGFLFLCSCPVFIFPMLSFVFFCISYFYCFASFLFSFCFPFVFRLLFF